MTTMELLRKIRSFCDRWEACSDCPIANVVDTFCDTPPEKWTDKEIEDLAEVLDNYEEEEE